MAFSFRLSSLSHHQLSYFLSSSNTSSKVSTVSFASPVSSPISCVSFLKKIYHHLTCLPLHPSLSHSVSKLIQASAQNGSLTTRLAFSILSSRTISLKNLPYLLHLVLFSFCCSLQQLPLFHSILHSPPFFPLLLSCSRYFHFFPAS